MDRVEVYHRNPSSPEYEGGICTIGATCGCPYGIYRLAINGETIWEDGRVVTHAVVEPELPTFQVGDFVRIKEDAVSGWIDTGEPEPGSYGKVLAVVPYWGSKIPQIGVEFSKSFDLGHSLAHGGDLYSRDFHGYWFYPDETLSGIHKLSNLEKVD